MRVLLVTSNYEPHIGGIERFVGTLGRGLVDRGHVVNVLCCRYEEAPISETASGVAVSRVRSSYVLESMLGVPYPLPNPGLLVGQLRKLLRSTDVVHVNDAIYATSATALVLAHRAQVPSVLTQHVGFVPQDSKALDVVQRIATSTIGRSARLATLVASYNPAVANWARDTWHIANARVAPVGVAAHSGPSAGRREVRRSFHLPEERFLALFVGRDVPKKGLDVFLGAVDPLYDLVAVTDRKATGEGSTTILPFMEPERLAELLSCVDAFVLPSEAEGVPLSLQEALGAGLPVVTTRQPGYERYLSAEDVVFVERSTGAVRDALRRLRKDDALRTALAERANAAAARHFGVSAFVSAYESLYAEASDLMGSSIEGPSAGPATP